MSRSHVISQLGVYCDQLPIDYRKDSWYGEMFEQFKELRILLADPMTDDTHSEIRQVVHSIFHKTTGEDKDLVGGTRSGQTRKTPQDLSAREC